MPAKRAAPLLQEITVRNLLSFGPTTPALPLQPLNVLIGPNGSGKSNLIEALCLARAAPGDQRAVFRRGGGVGEWLWKGSMGESARLDLLLDYRRSAPGSRGEGEGDSAEAACGADRPSLRHSFEFGVEGQAFRLLDERVQEEEPTAADSGRVLYEYRGGDPMFLSEGVPHFLSRSGGASTGSILAVLRDPERLPEISYLAEAYGGIRVFREWAFGRNTVFREPQQADGRTDRLEEDFSNLGLFLNHLRRKPPTKRAVLSHLRDLYDGLDDFDVSVEGGTVQVFFTEGDFTIPATRLSDGTLRYLCLLAILCDPEPPPLVCLEEPELGLHPDMLPRIADLLKDASTRTQLIVTTHSDVLVDALTDHPEAIVVCEKHQGATTMTRLDPDRLAGWLTQYRLGELWTRGELGGNRW
jgi:predicted ATPase